MGYFFCIYPRYLQESYKNSRPKAAFFVFGFLLALVDNGDSH